MAEFVYKSILLCRSVEWVTRNKHRGIAVFKFLVSW